MSAICSLILHSCCYLGCVHSDAKHKLVVGCPVLPCSTGHTFLPVCNACALDTWLADMHCVLHVHLVDSVNAHGALFNASDLLVC